MSGQLEERGVVSEAHTCHTALPWLAGGGLDGVAVSQQRSHCLAGRIPEIKIKSTWDSALQWELCVGVPKVAGLSRSSSVLAKVAESTSSSGSGSTFHFGLLLMEFVSARSSSMWAPIADDCLLCCQGNNLGNSLPSVPRAEAFYKTQILLYDYT